MMLSLLCILASFTSLTQHIVQLQIIQFHSHKVLSQLFGFTLLRSSALGSHCYCKSSLNHFCIYQGQSEISEISEIQLETIMRFRM